MKKFKKIVFGFISFTLLSGGITLWAQGPAAIEASAFEPVDATDMVNLSTGDFTYVLPLLNVPSPEGGYPIALSYHAGIGMDQEASWVGLGWNINPGAISRGVNGYPDDWKNGQLFEGFYDVGGEETSHNFTASYSSPGGQTIAATLAYNSNKGYGGSVSFSQSIPYVSGVMSGTVGNFGIGGSVGIQPGGQLYASANAGYKSKTGYSIGGSISTTGNFGVYAGYGMAKMKFGSKGASLSISKGTLGVSLSSKGINVSNTVNGIGISQNISFINSTSSSEYTVEKDQTGFALGVPTPIGTFSIGYSKQKIKWYLNSQKTSNVSGVFYLGDALKYECFVRQVITAPGVNPTYSSNTYYLDSASECSCSNPVFSTSNIPGFSVSCLEATLISENPTNGGKYFMDVNEIGVTNGHRVLDDNNAMFPAMDSYSVSAQGVSGSLSPKVSRTGALLGLTRNHTDSDLYAANYDLTGNSGFQNSFGTGARVDFQFKNQYSSSFTVEPGNFISNPGATQIYDYHEMNSGSSWVPRKRDGRLVSYYTLKDIRDGTATQQGLLLPKDYIFDDEDPYANITYYFAPNAGIDENTIAAFMVTAPDGKTYHYSLPVYNFKTSSRIIGTIDNKPERESYFENNQHGYATHWLLTAVTGPDYYNTASFSRKYPEVGDYGYWVRFDYGKYSELDAWKLPYAEDYEISEENPDIKTITYGNKELYYLDRVKTRTHTAIFVKNERSDDFSSEWERHAFFGGFAPPGGGVPSSANFDEAQWTIPSQKPLRLEKILLVRNEDDLIDKASGTALSTPGTLFPPLGNSSGPPDYNLHTNLVDVHDDIAETMAKAVKVIDFAPHYSYNLAGGTPNANYGRLTLNGVSFKGKGGVRLIPPYRFYYNNYRSFNNDQKDLWGYYKDVPEVWSMNRIITPTGGSINIAYESDDYELAAAETGRVFNRHLKFTFLTLPTSNNTPQSIQVKVEVDDQDLGTEDFALSDYFDPTETFHFDMWTSAIQLFTSSSLDIQPQQASIVSMDTTENSMIVEVMASRSNGNVGIFYTLDPVSYHTGTNGFDANKKKPRPIVVTGADFGSEAKAYSMIHEIISNKRPDGKKGGGLRVKELNLADTGAIYRTRYYYNAPGTAEDPSNPAYVSSGVISYQPFENSTTQTIAYGSQLPVPIPTYEYVTVKNDYNVSNGEYSEKTVYKFKVLEEKDEDNIRFGDLFEITEQTVLNEVNSTQNKTVVAKRFEVKDGLSCLGQLLEVSQYNGLDQLLSRTTNEYATPNEIPQGIVQESFETYKEVDYDNSNIGDMWYINSSKRVFYPSLLKSTTTLQGSHSSTTTFDRHDPITGMLLESTYEDSEGTLFKTEVIPAYTIPEYATGNYSMGPQLNDLGSFNFLNKNMLTQVAMNKTFIDDNGQWKLTGVGITTWSNEWTFPSLGEFEVTAPTVQKMWRKHKTFVWDGDVDENGIYQNFTGNYDSFDWTVGSWPDGVSQSNANWKDVSTITRYDRWSLPLETKDINEDYSITKMCKDNSQVLFYADSGYYESFYTSAENYYDPIISLIDPQVRGDASLRTTEKAHTGTYSLAIAPSDNTFGAVLKGGDHRAGTYKLSVWVHKDNYQNARFKQGYSGSLQEFNGEQTLAGDWVQLNHYFDRSASQTSDDTIFMVASQNGTIYVDDYRLHPITTTMISYVYNEWDEPAYILDGNNLATYYVYDAAGRLIETYNETIDDSDNQIVGGFKLAEKNYYRYRNQ